MASVLLAAIVLFGAPPAADSAVYPDDSFSRPQVDRWQSFETVTGVEPAGNPVQRMADYEVNELRAAVRDGKPLGPLAVHLPAYQRGGPLLQHLPSPSADGGVGTRVQRGQPAGDLRRVDAGDPLVA